MSSVCRASSATRHAWSYSSATRARAILARPGVGGGERGEHRQRGLQPLTGTAERHRLFLRDFALNARVGLGGPLAHRPPFPERALTRQPPTSPATAAARESVPPPRACADRRWPRG